MSDKDNMNGTDQWVFYLKLTKNLPKEFVYIDQELKKSGKTLVPIGLKTLLEHVKRNSSTHVMILVRSISEFEYFNRKIRKSMKLLMANRRVHLYIGSSFSTVNDPNLMRRDHYYYAKLPVEIAGFCQAVGYEIDRKETSMLKWPGGVRPRLSIAG